MLLIRHNADGHKGDQNMLVKNNNNNNNNNNMWLTILINGHLLVSHK